MLKITINVTNDAFGHSRFEAGLEVSNILKIMAVKAESAGVDSILGSLMDTNGNTCGRVEYTSEGWPTPPVGRPARPIEDWIEPVANRIAGLCMGMPAVHDALVLAFRENPEAIRPLIGQVIPESYFFKGKEEPHALPGTGPAG